MALRLMAGFDVTGNSTTTRFNSGRSLNIAGTTSMPLSQASTTIFAGWAMNWSFIDGQDRQWITFSSDNGLTPQITIAQFNGTIVARRGAQNGTLLASQVGVNTANQWHYFEVGATAHSSTGNVTVTYLGQTLINFTGNTRNGGTSSDIDTVTFGSTGGATFLFDDVYVCDSTGPAPYNTYLGDVRVYSLTPSAAGSSTTWTPDSGTNFSRVNEIPFSAANYVRSGTSGQRDTYAMTDLPATVGSILAVKTNLIAKKTDSPTIGLKPAIKTPTTVYYGATTTLSLNDVGFGDMRIIDPDTSVAWTQSAVNSLEAGMEVA